MRPMLAEEASALLYNYMQRLFKGRSAEIAAIRLDDAYRKEAESVIMELGNNTSRDIKGYSPGIQRYIYEILIHAFSLLQTFEPARPLPEPVEDWMTDDEKLALLLKNGIPKLIGQIPRSH